MYTIACAHLCLAPAQPGPGGRQHYRHAHRTLAPVLRRYCLVNSCNGAHTRGDLPTCHDSHWCTGDLKQTRGSSNHARRHGINCADGVCQTPDDPIANQVSTLRSSTVSHTDGTAQHMGHVRAPTPNALFAHVLHLPTQTSDSCAGRVPLRPLVLVVLCWGCSEGAHLITLKIMIVRKRIRLKMATILDHFTDNVS